jgi:hypothetical protein
MSLHVTIDTEALDLGTVSALRFYHLLTPASDRGDVDIHIQSPTIQLPGDPRQLGVLLDGILLQSLGRGTPPTSLLAASMLCLTLLTFVFAMVGIRRRLLLILLMTIAVLLGLAPLAYRGHVALTPWWLGLSLSAVVGLGLALADHVAFLCSLPGIVVTVAVWRVVLWLIGGTALWWSGLVNRYGRGLADFGTVASHHDVVISRILTDVWMQWDSLHYWEIATSGYTFDGVAWPTIAFFPLYPLLIRLLLSFAAGNATIAALGISNLALLGAVLLMYDVLAHEVGRVAAYRSVLLLLIFPTSFYLGAGYAEALALLLTAASVWALRRKRWWLAGAAGFLLALTRVPGVMVAPALACAYLQFHDWKWRSLFRLPFLAVLLPPLGLASFMVYQWSSFGTPFAFLLAQQSWDNGMAAPWVMPGKLLQAVRSPPRWELAAV